MDPSIAPEAHPDGDQVQPRLAGQSARGLRELCVPEACVRGGEDVKLRADKVKAAKAAAEEAGRSISVQERLASGKLTDGDVLRCAKRPWEEAFGKERVLKGWQKGCIFPKYNCALFWRLKEEESQQEGTDSSRPVVKPDEEWLRKFNAPHSSAAAINCDPKWLQEDTINAEVDKRVQAQLAGAPAPERLPAITAGHVFKLKGSASGEQMAHIMFEKEVQGRVEEKLKEFRKEDRDTKKSPVSELTQKSVPRVGVT
eukprot:465448-Prymnesium_polylepis.2